MAMIEDYIKEDGNTLNDVLQDKVNEIFDAIDTSLMYLQSDVESGTLSDQDISNKIAEIRSMIF